MPSRAPDQHLKALEVANARRLQKADDKRRIRGSGRAGSRLVVADILDAHLEGTADAWTNATVESLLRCVVGIERRSAVRLLNAAGIHPNRRVYQLTMRQSLALAGHLREQARHHFESTKAKVEA